MATTTSSAERARSGSRAAMPLWNAALVVAALGYSLTILANRGRISWPPTELLSGLVTVAGALALIGPPLLWRAGSGEKGAGDLAWLSIGLMVWLLDLAALAQGAPRGHSWVAPIEAQTLGMAALAILLAAWRARGAGPWTWTNTTGWVLAIFWAATALVQMIPERVATSITT